MPKRHRVTLVQADVCSIVYDVNNLLSFFSKTSRDWVASFYRRCLSLIYYLFKCLTEDLHCQFHLPTIEKIYKKCLLECMKNIQLHESVFIGCVLQNKHLFNTIFNHYRIKAYIRNMPAGGPNQRIRSFLDDDCCIF